MLRREQILVTAIDPVESGAPSAAWLGRRNAVSPRSLAVFTRQLAVMIDAGLPLVQWSRSAGESRRRTIASPARFARCDPTSKTARRWPDALRAHPRSFDRLYTSMVAAGEAGGVLDAILERLAAHIEKQVVLGGQVRSAMMYPLAVLSIAAGVVGVILWKVIPTFAALFEELGAVCRRLPTRLVVAAGDSFAGAVPLIALGMLSAALLFRRYYSTSSGRRAIDGRHAPCAFGGRHRAPERGRSILPDPVGVARRRRADPRKPGHHCRQPRETRWSRTRS